MSKQYTLEDLNHLDREAFTDVLGGIYEHSPWIAEQAWNARPFSSPEALREAMMSVVRGAAEAQQLALLRAHPELAGRAARDGQLTASSTQEQKGAGLTDLTQAQMEQIAGWNKTYGERFGFPFIIAVKNHTRDSIFSEFEKRLENSREAEIQTAIGQVGEIARFRLADLLVAN